MIQKLDYICKCGHRIRYSTDREFPDAVTCPACQRDIKKPREDKDNGK